MRSHLKTHDRERSKVICSVGKCQKKYADMKAWTVHFSSCHQKQMNRFNFFKERLGSESVVNPFGAVDPTLLEKLMMENDRLRTQITKILKIKQAKRLVKRGLKQSLKSFSNTQLINKDEETVSAAHALLMLRNI